MHDPRAARADLITGAVLFVLSIAVLHGSWTMDRLEIRQIHPLTVPGLLPGLLGVALALCSLILVVQAVRARRAALHSQAFEAGRGDVDDGSVRHLALTAVFCLVYALGLVGRIPFWLATALFVAAFILTFEWQDGGSRREKLASLTWALAIGLATGLGVAYAFSELFLVRLP